MNNIEIILIIYLVIALITSSILAFKNWKKYLINSKDKETSERFISAIEFDKRTRYLVIFLLTITITIFFPIVALVEFRDYIQRSK